MGVEHLPTMQKTLGASVPRTKVKEQKNEIRQTWAAEGAASSWSVFKESIRKELPKVKVFCHAGLS